MHKNQQQKLDEIPVGKRFLEKRNLISIKRLNQIKTGTLSKSGNLIASFVFGGVTVYDLQILKPKLTIFDKDTENIYKYCFLNDKKICIWVENGRLERTSKGYFDSIFLKVYEIENGICIKKLKFKKEMFTDFHWKQTFDENVLVCDELYKLFYLEENRIVDINLTTKISKMGFIESNEYNTELIIKKNTVYLISLKNEFLMKFENSLSQNFQLQRESMLTFWINEDENFFLFSFDSKNPLKHYKIPKCFNFCIYGNLAIYNDIKGIHLCSLELNNTCLTLETISTKSNSFQIHQQNGYIFIEYHNGTLLMKFKDDLKIFHILQKKFSIDLKFNFI